MYAQARCLFWYTEKTGTLWVYRFMEEYVVVCRKHLCPRQIGFHKGVSRFNFVGSDDIPAQISNYIYDPLVTTYFPNRKIESVALA